MTFTKYRFANHTKDKGGKILKECLVEKQEIVKEPTQQKSMHMQEYRVSRKYNISIEL